MPINANRRIGLELARLHQEVTAARFESLDLGEHALGQFGIAGGERNHNRFRVFAEQLEYEFLKCAPQWNSIAVATPAVLSLASGFAV